MVQLKKTLDSALSEIRSKRSLQYGLLAMALLFCSELLLQWTDWQDAQEKQWQQLRSELRTLRHQSRDEATLRNQLSELEAQQRIVGERLWRVSSEAVGQARLKDWLGEQLKKAGINKFKLTLSTPTVLDARRAEELAKREIRLSPPPAGEKTLDLYELRANLNFSFTPATLEAFLLAIEGSEAFTSVESLKVTRRDRSADLGMRILVRIQPDPPPAAEKAAAPPEAANAEASIPPAPTEEAKP